MAQFSFVPREQALLRKSIIIIKSPHFYEGQLVITVQSLLPQCAKLFQGFSFRYLEPTDNPIYLNEVSQTALSIKHNINPNLTKIEEQQLCELLEEFFDIFAESTSAMGYTDLVTHSFESPEEIPQKSRPYRVSHTERQVIQEQVEKTSNMVSSTHHNRREVVR